MSQVGQKILLDILIKKFNGEIDLNDMLITCCSILVLIAKRT